MSVSFEDKEVWILSGSVTDCHYQLLISFIKWNSLHCSWNCVCVDIYYGNRLAATVNILLVATYLKISLQLEQRMPEVALSIGCHAIAVKDFYLSLVSEILELLDWDNQEFKPKQSGSRAFACKHIVLLGSMNWEGNPEVKNII